MKITMSAQNRNDLLVAQKWKASEVLIAPQLLSRFGKLSLDEAQRLAQEASELQLRPILVWDLILTDDQLGANFHAFSQLESSYFSAIRIQDPGVLQFLLSKTTIKLQWMVDSGNHNLMGLKKWQDYLAQRLDRLILSSEIPFTQLQAYRQALTCQFEILGAGKILLFSTPRPLLSSALKKKTQELMARVSSEENAHKGFLVLENEHGSFMFHTKDLFLMDREDEIKTSGVDWLRVDLQFLDNQQKQSLNEAFKGDWKQLKTLWPNPHLVGLFLNNRTDVLFKKLKNPHMLLDEQTLGEVKSVEKGQFMGLQLRKGKTPLKLGQSLQLKTPEGKTIRFSLHQMFNAFGEPIESAQEGQFVLVNAVKGACMRSQVFSA